MAKNRGESNGTAVADAPSTTGEAQSTQQSTPEVAAAGAVTVNRTLHFKRNHPQNRASYGIPGVPGIVVVQRDLVAGTTPFTSVNDLAGMPATIEVGFDLALPKVDNKQAKAEAAALKAKEKAEKAAARVLEQQRKAEEKAAKAKAALEAVQVKLVADKAKAEGGDTPTA